MLGQVHSPTCAIDEVRDVAQRAWMGYAMNGGEIVDLNPANEPFSQLRTPVS